MVAKMLKSSQRVAVWDLQGLVFKMIVFSLFVAFILNFIIYCFIDHKKESYSNVGNYLFCVSFFVTYKISSDDLNFNSIIDLISLLCAMFAGAFCGHSLNKKMSDK